MINIATKNCHYISTDKEVYITYMDNNNNRLHLHWQKGHAVIIERTYHPKFDSSEKYVKHRGKGNAW